MFREREALQEAVAGVWFGRVRMRAEFKRNDAQTRKYLLVSFAPSSEMYFLDQFSSVTHPEKPM